MPSLNTLGQVQNLSATGKGTICNMGAKKVLLSYFPYGKKWPSIITGREKVAELANEISTYWPPMTRIANPDGITIRSSPSTYQP